MPRGLFITFEGGEGVGKSTQIRALAERLLATGRDVVTTREPGGTPFAEKVRDLVLQPEAAARTPLAEALLFSAARADHIAHLIQPALRRGAVVLSDRFADSTRAYQGAAGGLDATSIAALEALTLGDVRVDLTIILDLDPKVGLARANTRRGAQSSGSEPGGFIVPDTFEARDLAFHARLRQAFLDIAAAEPERCVVVDAFANPLLIADRIAAIVGARLTSAGVA
jgi:dTMP kinase